MWSPVDQHCCWDCALAPSSLPGDPLILKVAHTMRSQSFTRFSKDEAREKMVTAGICDRIAQVFILSQWCWTVRGTYYILRFPWWLSGKESTCSVGDVGLISGWRRSPAEGNGYQYSCPENSIDRGAWQATVQGSQRVGHNWSDWAHITYSLKNCCSPSFHIS